MTRFLPFKLLILVLSIFAFTCCSFDDGGGSRIYKSQWGVVHAIGDDLYLLADNGDVLKPSLPLDTATIEDRNRVWMLYLVLGESMNYSTSTKSKMVEVEELRPVVERPIAPGYDFIGINGDSIVLNSTPFIGGGFVNFDFGFNYSDINTQHSVELVLDTIQDRICKMRFLHLAKGDVGIKRASYLVSFPLQNLNVSSVDSLIIQVNPFGSVLKTIRLSMKDSIPSI